MRNQLEADTFSHEEREQIRQAIRKKYINASSSAKGLFKYQTGKSGAEALGYDREILQDIPEDLLRSFCGVGNPFSLGVIKPGDSFLDIGCGAGFDLIVARRKAGQHGRVCGVDLTPEMIERARQNFENLAIGDIETFQVDSETLPFDDDSFDVISSNGVINLSPAKKELFAEMYRIIKPGGRVQFADMVLDRELPSHMAASLEAWSQ